METRLNRPVSVPKLDRFGKAVHNFELRTIGLRNQHAARICTEIQSRIELRNLGLKACG
jgi:hypothetical protein